ncbi:MAG: hypothetical protein WBF93_02030 [Pirellulales bacterium]|nr:hypothetical protein [Pirellulales bacterium]
MPTTKTLDQKIARILADSSVPDFILADAKDADMAFGLSAPGLSPEYHGSEAQFRTLDEYRQQIREVVRQGLVDIMLMSASTSDVLTLGERIFDNVAITPAIRANDTTDIWLAAGSGRYGSQPSVPFRSATIDHAMCGHERCDDDERQLGADLGLYSITLNNDVTLDHRTLDAYRKFRIEAEAKGFRHFLEVFAPNACGDHCPEDVARFMNDSIVRTLAGVPEKARPIFLKIPYLGPQAMEALVRYDRSIIVGILGGSSGTTFDAFQMLWEAKKYGARAALYGRKINNSEHQLTFIKYLRALADDQIEPVEAVKSYHADLQRLNIHPHRALDEDLQSSETAIGYAGTTRPTAQPTKRTATSRTQGGPAPDEPDFSNMTQQEKVQWNLERWRRILD